MLLTRKKCYSIAVGATDSPGFGVRFQPVWGKSTSETLQNTNELPLLGPQLLPLPCVKVVVSDLTL
jgi:hypothetical protein